MSKGPSEAYVAGLCQAACQSPLVFPMPGKRKQELQQIAQGADAKQVAALVTLASVPQRSLLFDGVRPMQGDPLTHLAMPFGESPIGWYFMFGQTATVRFTYMLFRIAPGSRPTTSDEVLFSVVAGFEDETQGGYVVAPHNAAPAAYSVDKDGNISVQYLDEVNGVKSTLDLATDGTVQGSVILDSPSHPRKLAFMLEPQSSAQYNGKKGGCTPACFGGTGMSYWSFPRMRTTAAVDDRQPDVLDGTGWFDHQWLNAGIPRGFWNQLLYSTIAPRPTTAARWLWSAVQLTEGPGKQYMLIVPVQEQDLPLRVGSTFARGSFGNGYTSQSVTYALGSTITVTAVQGQSPYVFPTALRVQIDGHDLTLKLRGNDAHVRMPMGSNWEGCATAYDTTSGAVVGYGFIEANNMLSDDDLRLQGCHAVGLAQTVGPAGSLSRAGHWIIAAMALLLLCAGIMVCLRLRS